MARGRTTTTAMRALAAFLLLAPLWGCWVEGRCKTEQDCEWPQICNTEGACVLECTTVDQCELEEICTFNRCMPAPGCAGCSFDNADHTCVHGDCQMGACHPGWIDANGLSRDGCEYYCTPTGEEICDELDNDCDGETDEGFDLQRDVNNCGRCGNVCPTPPNAIPLCIRGECSYQCAPGWFDYDPEQPGCETEECIPTGEEICDGIDNNCDGETDEGFDKTLPETCGPLCIHCEYIHAEALCVEGACEMGECEENWHHLPNGPWDGCPNGPWEGCCYYCVPTGPEECNGLDDDCNGRIDDGINCCPEGMVSIDSLYCIDIYEAHLVENGQGDLMAVSEAGVYPYWNRSLTPALANQYCEAAGKRLCTPAEWQAVCIGPDRTQAECIPTPENPDAACYCYGTSYDPVICNGIDTFGPGGYQLVTTGYMTECTNDYGIYDICGNVWEMTTDGLVRGGAFNCIDSASLHECLYSIEASRVIAIGFRCCY
ncbi:MAG: SUMF1/EgtB/PvdO family nonheme iron enzyme [Bradymonadales bacterium]|nr:SUMF1/EgtB/PvdO family nonheme iron enzyme [Bradymonadales bacterium]